MRPEQLQEKTQSFIKQKKHEAKSKGVIVGLSGGIDSATTLKLAVNALGPENVTALIMPGKPTKKDNRTDAIELAKDLDVGKIEITINSTVKAFEQNIDFEPSKETSGNIRARTRMVYTYAYANENNLLVLGTGNRTEYLLGYFTKYGDGATDIVPLMDLYKTEVKELARHIGLDEKFIQKEPTAGLWEGQTDEDEIGATYEEMDKILKKLIDQEKTVEETSQELDIEEDRIIKLDKMHQASKHKRKGPQGLKIFEERN